MVIISFYTFTFKSCFGPNSHPFWNSVQIFNCKSLQGLDISFIIHIRSCIMLYKVQYLMMNFHQTGHFNIVWMHVTLFNDLLERFFTSFKCSVEWVLEDLIQEISLLLIIILFSLILQSIVGVHLS